MTFAVDCARVPMTTALAVTPTFSDPGANRRGNLNKFVSAIYPAGVHELYIKLPGLMIELALVESVVTNSEGHPVWSFRMSMRFLVSILGNDEGMISVVYETV